MDAGGFITLRMYLMASGPALPNRPTPPRLLAYPHDHAGHADHADPRPALGTPVRDLRHDFVRRTLLPGMRRALRRRPVRRVPVVSHHRRQVLPPVRLRRRRRPSVGRPRIGHAPLGIASIALVALIALVAGRNFGLGFNRSASAPQPEPSTADQPVTGDAPFANANGDAGSAGVVRAPDISSMSPGERADRLFDRVMRLKEEGKQDSVEFFAPMVMSAYQMMGPLNADQHYDLGRIGEVTGVNGLARAEADTILKTDPTHLLGLALAAHAATAAKQPAAARQFYRRLLVAAPGETAKALPEYARHRNDIDAAIAEGKKMGIQE